MTARKDSPLEEQPLHIQQLVREAKDEYWAWRHAWESLKAEKKLIDAKMTRLNGMGVGPTTVSKEFGIALGTADHLLHGDSNNSYRR